MRVFVAGRGAFGAEVLKLVRERGHEVEGVSAPVGVERTDALAGYAGRCGTPVLPAGTLNAETLPGGVDLLVAAHSHDFIGRKTRGKLRLGAIGYHPSLLPLHRGRDAARWAIHMRERVTGGTVYWLNDVMDGGPVAAQDFCLIRPEDTARTLWRRELFPMGVRLIGCVLSDLEAGRMIRVGQDESLATVEPSFEQPRAFRPDLPEIGTGWEGLEVLTGGRGRELLRV